MVAVYAIIALRPLHPIQLWSAPWAIAAILYSARLLPYRHVSWQTAGLALGATLAFAAGALAVGRWTPPPAAPAAPKEYDLLSATAKLLAGLTGVVLIGYIAQAISRYGFRSTFISATPLREGIQQGHFIVTVKYVYVAMAAAAAASIAAACAPAPRQRRAWLTGAVACIASLYLATGRGTVVSGAIISAVTYATGARHPIRMRWLAASASGLAIMAVVVFLIGGALIGKTFANNPDLKEVPSVFSHHRSLSVLALPYEYVTAPLAALDIQVQAADVWGDGHGCAALHAFCTGLRDVGLNVPVITPVRPFTASPLPWNTYTALDVPLIDGGTALTIPIVALLGAFCGWLWFLACRGLVLGRVAYALAAVALLTSSGSFSFMAPQLVGAFLLFAAALCAVRVVPSPTLVARLRRDSQSPPAIAE
jgi:hypothetical protein